jgi:DNA-binding CsgD family transcriptional regulator
MSTKQVQKLLRIAYPTLKAHLASGGYPMPPKGRILGQYVPRDYSKRKKRNKFGITRQGLLDLLNQGMNYEEAAVVFGCNPATISFYAGRFGIRTGRGSGRRKGYDDADPVKIVAKKPVRNWREQPYRLSEFECGQYGYCLNRAAKENRTFSCNGRHHLSSQTAIGRDKTSSSK